MHARRTWGALGFALLLATTAACSSGADGGTPAGSAGSPSTTAAASSSKAEITSTIAAGAKHVKINRTVRLDVSNGAFTSVSVSSKSGQVAGTMSADKASWQSTDRLQPGVRYTIRGTADDSSGKEAAYSSSFRTQKLALDHQTYPSFFPTEGATVGIAMPVIIRFDVPVTDHASIQKHISVTSEPAQAGGFHWISNTELHWRPAKYWKAGTKVSVDADIDSVPAGNGIYGQKSRTNHFTIGRAQVVKVNTRTDQLTVVRDGHRIRTIPVTTGQQPEFTTRSGIKVIVEKDRRHDMNSETIGIDPNGPNGYNLKGVEYAMRLTYSGEFLHAAPWSVGSQGHANVSHGCTGMSTANAGWLYDHSLIGDPVEYTGTSRMMTLTNGLGDWNLSFKDYAQNTAL